MIMVHDGSCHKHPREKALQIQHSAPAATCLLRGLMNGPFPPGAWGEKLTAAEIWDGGIESCGYADRPFIRYDMALSRQGPRSTL